MVTNLIFPTAMTFGPDGALYVANYGNESNRGEGQILRVLPGTEPAAAPDVTPPKPGGLFNPGQKPERRPYPPEPWWGPG